MNILRRHLCMAVCEESPSSFYDRSWRYQGCRGDVQHRSKCWRQLRVQCGWGRDQVRPLPANQPRTGEHSATEPRRHRRCSARGLRLASWLEACDQEGRFSHYRWQVNRFLISLHKANLSRRVAFLGGSGSLLARAWRVGFATQW